MITYWSSSTDSGMISVLYTSSDNELIAGPGQLTPAIKLFMYKSLYVDNHSTTQLIPSPSSINYTLTPLLTPEPSLTLTPSISAPS